MRIAWKPLGWGLLIILVLATVLGVLVARQFWHEALQDNGIEKLEWRGLNLSLSGVSVSELKLNQSQPARDITLQTRSLALAWRWPEWGEGWRPQLTALTAGYLNLDWQAKSGEQQAAAPVALDGWPSRSISWLPSEMIVQKFDVTLPCETGRCSLAGALSITGAQPGHGAGADFPLPSAISLRFPVKASVQLDHDGHQVGLLAVLDGPSFDNLSFSAELAIDGTQYVSATSDYRYQNENNLVFWNGSVEVPDLPQMDWLLAWLQTWQSIPSEPLLNQPETGSVKGNWQVEGPRDESFLAKATGNVSAYVRVPQPWPLPGVGKVSGDADVALEVDQGLWLPKTLNADLELSHPAVWIQNVPELLRPNTLKLSVRSSQPAAPSSSDSSTVKTGGGQTLLPLNVELSSRGAANLSVHSHLTVAIPSPWMVQSGLDQLSLSGPVSLSAKQVNHPQLLVQSWQFDGNVESDLVHTDLVGLLKAGTGTTMNLDLKFPHQGPLRFEGKMRVSGKQEADALSRIFAAWPSLLTVSGGTVSADATYEQSGNGGMGLAGKLVFADWSGTYDRTAWSKMNGSLAFAVENDRVRVTTPELTIGEVNAGMPVGPVLFAGQYQAPVSKLSAGQLTLDLARSGALGGEVQVQAGSWDLSQAPVRIPVEITRLSIGRLLQLYPAEGVAGTGILSGTVPVWFDPAKGIRVEQGRINALKPGGQLQVTAGRLKALASQSESMRLVAQALEDFHYSVLDSDIDYSEDGTLVLSLHLEGNSADAGKDQPMILNISLEENIPALLISLQLSGRVSDAVTKRVKEILKKRERVSGDLLE